MSTPPSWAPTLGERYGDWVGVQATPGFIFWDLYDEKEVEEKVTSVYVASKSGVNIRADVRFTVVDSEDDLAYVTLPTVEDFGIGNTMHLQSGNTGYRIRCDYDDSQAAINRVVCNIYNELYVPPRCSVVLTAARDKAWRASITSPDGTSIPAIPNTRNFVNLIDESGYQVLTAIAPTDVNTEYDHVDDYYVYSGPLGSGAEFSIGAWIYPYDTTGFSTIAGTWGNGAPDFAWIFRHDQTGRIEFVTSDDGTTNIVADSSPVVTQDEWQHVMAIFDNGSVSFYRNNVSAGTASGLPTPIYDSPDIEYTVGVYKPDNITHLFNGQMAHIVWEETIWNSSDRNNVYNTAPPDNAYYFPLGNGTEKRQFISELEEFGAPTVISDVPIVSSNTRRCYIKASTAGDIVQGPQLRAGQECVIRAERSCVMIFPYSVDGSPIVANDFVVSDWRKVLKLFPSYNYHIKALRNNEYEIREVDLDGQFTAPIIT